MATAAIATMLVTSAGSADHAAARTDGYRCDDAGHVCAWNRGSAGGVQTWATAFDLTQRALGDLDRSDLTFEETGNPTAEPTNPDRITLSPPPGHLSVPIITALMLTEHAPRLVDDVCTDTDDAAMTYEQLMHVLTQPDPDGVAPDAARQLLDSCA